MSTSSAQDLVNLILPPEDQEAVLANQLRQFTLELLAWVNNAERLEAEAASLPDGDGKDQVLAALAEATASMGVVQRAAELTKAKLDGADSFAGVSMVRDPSPEGSY
jgi:hypothetical protein